jgi:hypothetical protein
VAIFLTVVADNSERGFLTRRYLVDLGHRVIVHLTGPREHGNLSERTKRSPHPWSQAGGKRILLAALVRCPAYRLLTRASFDASSSDLSAPSPISIGDGTGAKRTA